MDLAQLTELIRQHGETIYAFVFAYAASHALLMAIFAGYAAQLGLLDLTRIIVFCWAGSFAGDVFRFWLARRYGDRVLAKFPRVARHTEMVKRMVHRHALWLPLVHRYPYGIRGLGAFAYGMSNISWGSFLVLNFIGAGLWAVPTVAAGYAFGQVSDKVLGDTGSTLSIASLILFLALSWILSRKLEQAMAVEVKDQR